MRSFVALLTILPATTSGAPPSASSAVGHLEPQPREIVARERFDLQRGGAVFVRLRVPLSAPPTSALRATPLAVRAARSLSAPVLVEVVATTSTHADVRYAVRGHVDGPELAELKFVLEVRESETATLLGRLPVRHQVRMLPLETTAAELAFARRTYAHHWRAAQQTFARLPDLREFLRLDRLTPPPPAARVPRSRRADLASFLHHRLRADLALHRLRAAVESDDEPLALEAARALGASGALAPSSKPSSTESIDTLTVTGALDMAQSALEDVSLERAEAIARRVRTSGRVDLGELARTFAILGGVAFLRGEDPRATRFFGRALCLRPGLDPRFRRPFLRRRFSSAQSGGGCASAPQVEAVEAERRSTAAGSKVVVEATLSADPHLLFSKGVVLRWGPGGRPDVRRTAAVARSGSNVRLTVEFEDDEATAAANDLVLQVLLQDPSGVTLAAFGDPTPRSVPIRNADVSFGGPIPTWLWVVSGSLALIGGTIAGVWMLRERDDVQRGIGPVEVRF